VFGLGTHVGETTCVSRSPTTTGLSAQVSQIFNVYDFNTRWQHAPPRWCGASAEFCTLFYVCEYLSLKVLIRIDEIYSRVVFGMNLGPAARDGTMWLSPSNVTWSVAVCSQGTLRLRAYEHYTIAPLHTAVKTLGSNTMEFYLMNKGN